MRGSRYAVIKPLALKLCRENIEWRAIDVIEAIRQRGYDNIPTEETIRIWRRTAGINGGPPISYSGFGDEYRARIVEVARACRHIADVLARIEPDERGKKPGPSSVSRWLKAAGAKLGQDAEPAEKDDAEDERPVVRPIRAAVQGAALELIDPDVYAGAIDPFLRNMWGRLYMDDQASPWLVVRPWVSDRGEYMFSVIPERADLFKVWARGTMGFVEKMRELGFVVRLATGERRMAA